MSVSAATRSPGVDCSTFSATRVSGVSAGPGVFIGKALHVASQYELSSIARPVAVTRHGATVGYFIPARAGHPDLDRAALKRLKAGEANRAANFTTGFQEFAAPACP